MATIRRAVRYPTRDGRPMGETDIHIDATVDLIRTLQDRYADDPDVYVSGDLLVFYEEGNGRRHLAPDVFVALGVPKRRRENYLIWEEGKGPDLVIEVTSRSTRREDEGKKFDLYRDVIRVPEYFRFDPLGEYLRPALVGHRLVDGAYEPIVAVDGRLPSEVTGLHLEARGTELRLFDPATGLILPTARERAADAEAARRASEAARRASEARLLDAETARRASEAARRESEARADAAEGEVARLLREIEALTRGGDRGL